MSDEPILAAVGLTLPLLTIAVPTYNRAECLAIVLTRLLEEVESLPAGHPPVEIIVIDNASTDETEQQLAKFSPRPWLRLLRNPTNVGMDRNFVRCLDEASGRWLWLFSDDDLPMIGAISTLLGSLKDSSCAMVFLPTVFKYGDLSADRQSVDRVNPMRLEDARSFAARVNGLFTFISGMVVNREAYTKVMPAPQTDRLVGTYFAHLEWVYELLARSHSFGFFGRPLVVARAGNSGGYDFVRVFTDRFHLACRLKLSSHPELLRVIIDGMRFRHLPKLFFYTRSGSNGNLELNADQASRAILGVYGRDVFYFTVMWPLLHLPLSFAPIPLFIARVWGKLWFELKYVRSRRAVTLEEN